MKRHHLIIILALALTACGSKGESPAESGDATQQEMKNDSLSGSQEAADSTAIDGVTSATNVANSPTFNGQMIISPDQQATVSSTMGGRIHSLNIMPGKAVARGQVIATLDNPDFIELQQEYLEASAQLEYLEKEYHRQTTLGSQEAASQKRVQQSKADYLSMKSKAEAASARLKALGVSPQTLKTAGIMAYLPVKAPISGYVTNMNANLGKYIETGTAVCDIINKHAPLIQLTVYEKDIHLMRAGGAIDFRINGMGKATFSATIVSIDQSVDKEDYSIKVYAKVNAANAEFRPGMYVRAKIKNSGL